MNICFVSRTFPPEIGGSGAVAFNAGKELVKKGHKVFVVTPKKEEPEERNRKDFETQAGMKVYRVNVGGFNPHKTNIFSWGKTIAKTASVLAKVCKENRIDVVHSFDFSLGAPVCIVSKNFIPKTRFVQRYGGDLTYEIACRKKINGWDPSKGVESSWKLKDISVRTALAVEKFYLRFFDVVTPTTEHSKRLLEKLGLKREKIFLVGSGVDSTLFSPKKKEKRKMFRILSGGRFEKWKKFESLVRAVAKLKENNFEVELSLFGEGAEKKNLEQLSNVLDLRKNVFFPGPISHSELSKEFSKCDVFVSTSAPNIGISNIVLEALASGTVVLSNAIPGAREVIEHGENGFLFKNKEELYITLEAVASKKHNLKKIRANARKIAVKNFSYAGVADDFLRVYSTGLKAF